MFMNVTTTIKTLAVTAIMTVAVPFAATAQTTDISEDFSLFTEGSEDSPSAAINSENGNIPARYFHTTGWSGYGVHQAGGACALINPDQYGAQLNTAVGTYSGAYVVKVRAKTLSSNYQDNTRLNIGLWEEAENQYNQTTYYENFVTTKSEWREFTFKFDNNSSYANSNRMLVSFYTDGKVLIDDIHVYKSTELTAPVAYRATNFTVDGFTANWAPVENATHYLFSLFHNVKTPVTQTEDFTEDFSSLSNGTLPEGWTYTPGTNGAAPELYVNEEGGVKSAIKIKNGDIITMPDNGGRLTALTFSFIECKMPRNVEDLWGTELIVEMWDGFNWKNFTTVQIDASEYGNQLRHEFDWSRFFKKDKYKSTKVRFRMSGLPDDCAFGLTDFSWSTESSLTLVYDLKDEKVEGTSYVVSGMNPETDYSYTIKAVNGDEVSASSSAVEADGLATPVVEPATDASHDSYTANWQAVPKASYYEVTNYDTYVAPEEEKAFVVLNEDFSKIADTGVTIEKPMAFQNSNYMTLGSNMTYRTGWQCIWGGYADGCFVGTGMTDYNISGELLTPMLTLSNDEGCFHVKVTARSMIKDDELVIYSKGSGKGVRLNITPDEWRTFNVDLTDGQESDIVVFTTANHYPFIIDDIKITQNLSAGDRVYEDLLTYTTDEEETSQTVTNLKKPEVNHSYAYTVTAVRQRQTGKVTSERSAFQNVDTFLGVNDIKENAAKTETGRFTIDGRKADKNTRGLIIVKYADGSATTILRR